MSAPVTEPEAAGVETDVLLKFMFRLGQAYLETLSAEAGSTGTPKTRP